MSNDVQTGRLIPYLVEMFRYQAWLGMGKIAHPISGNLERDLNMAKAMIDFMTELEERTEGNRSQDETLLLQGTVTDLQLNYMEEMKKPQPKPEEESDGKTAEESGSEEATECCDGDCDCGDDAGESCGDDCGCGADKESTESS